MCKGLCGGRVLLVQLYWPGMVSRLLAATADCCTPTRVPNAPHRADAPRLYCRPVPRREHVRRRYDEIGVGQEVPPELAKPLRVGQEVVARHPQTRQLHDGSILTIKGSKYRCASSLPYTGCCRCLAAAAAATLLQWMPACRGRQGSVLAAAALAVLDALVLMVGRCCRVVLAVCTGCSSTGLSCSQRWWMMWTSCLSTLVRVWRRFHCYWPSFQSTGRHVWCMVQSFVYLPSWGLYLCFRDLVTRCGLLLS